MNINEKLLQLIQNCNGKYLSLKQIYTLVGCNSSHDRKIVQSALENLTEQAQLVYDEPNKRFRLPEDGEFGTAVFQANAKGFGFLLMDGQPDLFVPAAKTNGAFHMDTVKYHRVLGTRDEAEIYDIVSRGMTDVVGTVDKSGNAVFVIPDEKRFISDIFVPHKQDMRARHGQKVVVHITDYPEDNRDNPTGEITQILGYPDDKDVEMLSVAYSFGIRCDFPENVTARAAKLPTEVTESDIVGRRDLRNQTIFTIDGEDAKDLDDAVSVAKNNDGTYMLGVHIADVSNYVQPGGDIDKEAFLRGTSVYFPQTVFPMLPVALSNGVCSLYEGVDRLTLTCEMTINNRGKIVGYDIYPSVIRSCHRMTYTAVQAIFDGDKATCDKYADILPDLRTMQSLAKILAKKRDLRGNIDFATKEVYFVYDDHGFVVDVKPYEHTFAHQLIEEFMIAANESVADYATELGLPFVYRVHDKPDEEKMNTLLALMGGVGITVKHSKEMCSSVLQDALRQAENTPYFNLINDVMLRTMQKAKYSTVNSGHFGLASRRYCHFTSPIRRYPDLIVHRILKTAIAGKMTEKALRAYAVMADDCARQSSIREKVADDAERKADDIKKCQYAETIIGQTFPAIISGVTENGIFCSLPNTVEGFVSVDKLGGYFAYNKEHFCLYNDAMRYALGDKVFVTVDGVNKQTVRIEMSLADCAEGDEE